MRGQMRDGKRQIPEILDSSPLLFLQEKRCINPEEKFNHQFGFFSGIRLGVQFLIWILLGHFFPCQLKGLSSTWRFFLAMPEWVLESCSSSFFPFCPCTVLLAQCGTCSSLPPLLRVVVVQVAVVRRDWEKDRGEKGLKTYSQPEN